MDLSREDWDEFERGVSLFNAGKFWHAHEAWEEVWKRRREDERLVFQALIQVAAAYHHLLVKKNYTGLVNNLAKAHEKLKAFEPEYLGVSITPLVRAVELAQEESASLDQEELGKFNLNLIAKLEFRKPPNPDLLVEFRDVLRSEEFKEGLRLFNTAYYWEAHEQWEELWRELQGETKVMTQVFVQIAAAYSFLSLARPSSSKYLLEKGLEKLASYGNVLKDLELEELLTSMKKHLKTIDQNQAAGHHDRHAPVIRLRPNAHNGES
jgi:predicted metal-dependent hydrolase